MGDYIYYWDHNNKKKVYGGKYLKVSPKADGYYGTNEAGVAPEFIPKQAGDSVGFKGNNLQEYIFSDNVHGTRTIIAISYEDALRQAKIFGFTSKDYKPKRKRGK